jgi:hypothetical protein
VFWSPGQQFEMLGGYGHVRLKRRSGEGLAIRADPLERSRPRRTRNSWGNGLLRDKKRE